MEVFITGASGWIASALIPELAAAGHNVTGLARSDAAAEVVQSRGATVVRGTLTDLDTLASAASAADGVVHLAFPHDDMSGLKRAAAIAGAAASAMTGAMAGTGKPIVAASGTPAVPGRASTENDLMLTGPAAARGRNETSLLGAADDGIRPPSRSSPHAWASSECSRPSTSPPRPSTPENLWGGSPSARPC